MRRTINSEFLCLIHKYNARRITSLAQAKRYPFEAVAFETRNFGWVLSAMSLETGKRKIIEYR